MLSVCLSVCPSSRGARSSTLTPRPRLGRFRHVHAGFLLQEMLPQFGESLFTGWTRRTVREVVIGQRWCARRSVHQRTPRETQTHVGRAASPGPSQTSLFSLLVRPAQQGGDQLKHLKLLRIRAVESEEMQKMIRDNMPRRVSRSWWQPKRPGSSRTCPHYPRACLS